MLNFRRWLAKPIIYELTCLRDMIMSDYEEFKASLAEAKTAVDESNAKSDALIEGVDKVLAKLNSQTGGMTAEQVADLKNDIESIKSDAAEQSTQTQAAVDAVAVVTASPVATDPDA